MMKRTSIDYHTISAMRTTRSRTKKTWWSFASLIGRLRTKVSVSASISSTAYSSQCLKSFKTKYGSRSIKVRDRLVTLTSLMEPSSVKSCSMARPCHTIHQTMETTQTCGLTSYPQVTTSIQRRKIWTRMPSIAPIGNLNRSVLLSCLGYHTSQTVMGTIHA